MNFFWGRTQSRSSAQHRWVTLRISKNVKIPNSSKKKLRVLVNLSVHGPTSNNKLTTVSTHCDWPITVHLIYTMEYGSLPLKNGLILQNSKIFMIIFLKNPSVKIRSGGIFFRLDQIFLSVSIKSYWQNNKSKPIFYQINPISLACL